MKRLLLLGALQSALLLSAQTAEEHLFYEDFATKNNFSVNWVVLDKNNDKKTWEYISETASPGPDGNLGIAKYLYESKNQADDYLTMAAPVALKAGKHNLSFYFRTSTTRNKESMEVLYGKSNDVTAMTVLTKINEVSSNVWDISINDFEIEEAGNYYFTFHMTSAKNMAGFWLDNIAIDEGGFKGTPDIALTKLILPPSDCSLGVNPIGVTVKNEGTAPIENFTLHYEIDGGNRVSQEVTNKLGIGATTTITFTTPVDFSATEQAYNVKVYATCNGQEALSNDTLSGRVINLTPVTSLPFNSNFAKAMDALNWNPIVTNGWEWNGKKGCYKANTTSSLLSRCIHMTPGDYRILFNYNAGDELIIGGFKYDYFNVSFGKTGTDLTTWQKIGTYKSHTQNKIEKKEVLFTVTEEGDYDICFTSTDLAYLEIHDVTVSKIAQNDVKVETFITDMKLPRMLPQYQLNTNHKFTVSVVNYGKQEENNVKIELKANDQSLSSTTIPTLAIGEQKETIFDLNLSGIASSKDQPFSFIAQASINKDDYPADNMITLQTIVSDSTYVWDNPVDFQFGLGNSSAPVAFGSVFPIYKSDILTSVSLGFRPDASQANDRITLNVYKLNEENYMGTALLSKTVKRGEGGKELTVAVSALTMTPGKYLLEIKQEESKNMGLVADKSANGLIAASKNGFIEELPGYGYLYIRPNFSKNAPTGFGQTNAQETKVMLYPNPANENITIQTGGEAIEKVVISNLLGQPVLSVAGSLTSSQTVGISSLGTGTYLATIYKAGKIETIKLIIK